MTCNYLITSGDRIGQHCGDEGLYVDGRKVRCEGCKDRLWPVDRFACRRTFFMGPRKGQACGKTTVFADGICSACRKTSGVIKKNLLARADELWGPIVRIADKTPFSSNDETCRPVGKPAQTIPIPEAIETHYRLHPETEYQTDQYDPRLTTQQQNDFFAAGDDDGDIVVDLRDDDDSQDEDYVPMPSSDEESLEHDTYNEPLETDETRDQRDIQDAKHLLGNDPACEVCGCRNADNRVVFEGNETVHWYCDPCACEEIRLREKQCEFVHPEDHDSDTLCRRCGKGEALDFVFHNGCLRAACVDCITEINKEKEEHLRKVGLDQMEKDMYDDFQKANGREDLLLKMQQTKHKEDEILVECFGELLVAKTYTDAVADVRQMLKKCNNIQIHEVERLDEWTLYINRTYTIHFPNGLWDTDHFEAELTKGMRNVWINM
uniref:Uncharacterized protein n=1 Tax=viral metagenome TaxID=1070528 RepID=A0A6C0JU62_9ZZZZ